MTYTQEANRKALLNSIRYFNSMAEWCIPSIPPVRLVGGDFAPFRAAVKAAEAAGDRHAPQLAYTLKQMKTFYQRGF